MAPTLMPKPGNNRKRTMAAVLAGAATFAFLLVIVLLFFVPVPEANKDFFQTTLIALVGIIGTSFGYYLGTSDSSARKDDYQVAKVAGETEAETTGG